MILQARGNAAIEPQWIETLAPSLLSRSYAEPYYDEHDGTVKAKEQVSFMGLPIIKDRPVFYARIDRRGAHDVFVREALARAMLPPRYRFLRHNEGLRKQREREQAKARTRRLYAGDDAVKEFCRERTGQVSSVSELNEMIRRKGGDRFLFMQEKDIRAEGEALDTVRWPDTLTIGGAGFPLTYRFAPGADDDGVTVTVPVALAARIHEHAFEWALHPQWQERVAWMLSHLPRDLRKKFVPPAEQASRIAGRLAVGPDP
jgi:ATP-dependent helicase HrpA